MKIILVFLLLAGCSTNELLKPAPTKNDKMDVYINEFLTSTNLTACEKVVDVENHIDDFICVETATPRSYVIPSKQWEEKGFDLLFTRISKLQFRELLTHIKTFKNSVCKEDGVKCEEITHTNMMKELTPYMDALDD